MVTGSPTSLPLPPTSREALWLDGYLEYPSPHREGTMHLQPSAFFRIRTQDRFITKRLIRRTQILLLRWGSRFKKKRKEKKRKEKKRKEKKRKEKKALKRIFYDNLVALHFKYDQARRRFVEWDQNEIAVVPHFHKRILFSDKAHFWLNGYVNKQNCRIWSEANPQVYVETPLHPEKLTVWCALWAGGIIGPYFFKNDEGHNVTVNGDRYRAMITNFFIPELNNHDVQELWF
ncbi:hypothetical protein TNCV_3206011 [Trichonephila clavipes]|nr:hypothetical protein TNCV_3206011 [Trichonephila clavipes]